MKKKIKELRVKIDGLSQLVRGLKEDKNKESRFPFNSPECSKAYDSLILAKAWLGKILQELGVPTPYKKDGNRHTVEDIEPTADVNNIFTIISEKGKSGWKVLDKEYFDHIEKVDWLREKIRDIIKSDIFIFAEKHGVSKSIISIIHQHLTEAKFYLDFELGRIKDTQ